MRGPVVNLRKQGRGADALEAVEPCDHVPEPVAVGRAPVLEGSDVLRIECRRAHVESVRGRAERELVHAAIVALWAARAGQRGVRFGAGIGVDLDRWDLGVPIGVVVVGRGGMHDAASVRGYIVAAVDILAPAHQFRPDEGFRKRGRGHFREVRQRQDAP